MKILSAISIFIKNALILVAILLSLKAYFEVTLVPKEFQSIYFVVVALLYFISAICDILYEKLMDDKIKKLEKERRERR